MLGIEIVTNSGIMKRPNKSNIEKLGVFFLYGETIPLFVHPTFMDLVKTQIPG